MHAAPVCMSMLESEAKAFLCERQRAAAAVEPGSSRLFACFVPVDPEEVLLREVMRCSLTTVVTDVRLLWWRNVKALRLGLEASEHLTREKESSKAKATRHARQ